MKPCEGVAGVLGVVDVEEDLLFGVFSDFAAEFEVPAFELEDEGVFAPRPWARVPPGVLETGSSLLDSKTLLNSSHLLVRFLRKYTAISWHLDLPL